RLAPARRVLAASPDYLARHGTPATPAQLAQHRAPQYGHIAAAQRWQLTHGGGVTTLPVTPSLCSQNRGVLRAAALAGNGITLLPTFMLGPDIKAGRLAVVLPDYPPTGLGIYALYAPNRYLAAKTRLLIDFLAQRFGQAPAWDDF